MLADLIWRKTRCDCEKSTVFEEDTNQISHQTHNNSDSRVADVDPRINLMEVLGRPAVEAALVRQQVVELLERHLEARHVGWLTCLDPLVVFNPHNSKT